MEGVRDAVPVVSEHGRLRPARHPLLGRQHARPVPRRDRRRTAAVTSRRTMRFRLLPESSPLGWTPYAWLIYLPLFIAYAIPINDSALDWIIDGATMLVFLALYFRGFWERGNRLLAIAFAIVFL